MSAVIVIIQIDHLDILIILIMVVHVNMMKRIIYLLVVKIVNYQNVLNAKKYYIVVIKNVDQLYVIHVFKRQNLMINGKLQHQKKNYIYMELKN